MSFRIPLTFTFAILLGLFLSSCNAQGTVEVTQTLTSSPPTVTPLPPTPTVTPTPTEIPFYVDATVWTGNVQVPILIYHYFGRDGEADIPTTWMRFEDFKKQLQSLYDNGFSLVSLKDWLSGTFVVPAGRRPLIITIDDLWRADQLFINEDGNPSQYSGIGILWQFSKDHPDFGFAVSGFSNMGDKFFADTLIPAEKRYIRVSDDNSNIWKDELSKVMVWSLENGVQPYNHTYTHVQLDLTAPQDIQYQLLQNDIVTRFYLSRVNRQDLIPKLGNIIALPFGVWPATNSGIEVLKNYKNPESVPVSAILEAYNLAEAQLTPSIFTPGFDRFKIQRISASDGMIQFIINNKDKIPTAEICKVGPIAQDLASDLETLRVGIAGDITSGSCPEGIYNINGVVFVAQNGTVELYKP